MAGLVVVTCIALFTVLLVSRRWRRESSRIRYYGHEGSIVRRGVIPESDPYHEGKEGLLVRWDCDSDDLLWVPLWQLDSPDCWVGDPGLRDRVRSCHEKYVYALDGIEAPAAGDSPSEEGSPR